ncbi:forkhead associated domain containing protein [Aureococcus anophagefferens]|nr:forkhead associated domain containing protein [Aureococcus anophagefferens]
MGGGAGKHAKEPAQDVGDDEVFSPIVPEEKREDQGQGMSAHQSEKLKRKSMQINEAYAKADQKEMSIHVASLRACPAAKVPAPQVKKARRPASAPTCYVPREPRRAPAMSENPTARAQEGYSAPVKHEGWLSWATPSGQIKRYYQLVGCYLIRFKDEKSAKGTAIFPTYVHGVESIVEGAQEVSKEFIADMENRGKAWIAAVNDALKEAYTADEIAKKEASQAAMRPLLLDQAQIQFKRMNVILSNLRAAGFVAEQEKIKSKKKGYLEFQRVEYEDEQFYADLLTDEKPEEAQFSKMYCVLRSDQTIVYGATEHEAKSDPEGIISLNHLHVVLDTETIEKTGKMIFSLVTPLRTFVMKAAHQVALEEWLRAIIKVTAKLDDQGNTLAALNELSAIESVTDIDLHMVLDDDAGIEAYEHYIEEAAADKPGIQTIFNCWKLAKEYKDAHEYEDDGPGHQDHMKKLEQQMISKYLGGDGLPEDVSKEPQEDFKKAVSDGQPPPMGALRAVCLTKLMEKTYEGFKETPAYKAYKRLQKMTHAKTKLKSVGKKDDGEKIYEAWTFLKSKEGKDKSTTIGRDHKQDVAVDDDKKVSREHARIDCTGDGKVIFMDLGSSHGSKVNGKSVAGRVSLAVGDVIKVGKTKILFTIIPAGAEDPIR